MQPFQKLVATDGLEVALFPFQYLYMSQDEGGDFSHVNTYNIDFIGWGENGRILKCPFYAPVTLECVNNTWDTTSHNIVYQSKNPVHLADGSVDYLTISFAHDDNPIYSVGDIIPQGNILGHTGTTGNVTGDHIHTCCGKGKYIGYTKREGGHWDLTNRIHYWDAVFVNDSVIVRGYNHPWLIYEGGSDPIVINRGKFPWILYRRKIRNLKV